MYNFVVQGCYCITSLYKVAPIVPAMLYRQQKSLVNMHIDTKAHIF